jgi:hypothetical protein
MVSGVFGGRVTPGGGGDWARVLSVRQVEVARLEIGRAIHLTVKSTVIEPPVE